MLPLNLLLLDTEQSRGDTDKTWRDFNSFDDQDCGPEYAANLSHLGWSNLNKFHILSPIKEPIFHWNGVNYFSIIEL